MFQLKIEKHLKAPVVLKKNPANNSLSLPAGSQGKARKELLHGLSNPVITVKNDRLFLFYQDPESSLEETKLATSRDGVNFKQAPEEANLYFKLSSPNISVISPVPESDRGSEFFLTCLSSSSLKGYISRDLMSWREIGKLTPSFSKAGSVAQHYLYQNNYVMYFTSGRAIKLSFSKDFKNWKLNKNPVLEPRKGHFDNYSVEIASSPIVTEEGIIVVYNAGAKVKGQDKLVYSPGIAVFDKHSPSKLIYRSDLPLLEATEKWEDKNQIIAVNLLEFGNKLFLYYLSGESKLKVADISLEFTDLSKVKQPGLKLTPVNGGKPVLKPMESHSWEAKAVFNPAAITLNNKVHIIYRAITQDDVSVLGYASSKDGVTIDERSQEPVYVPKEEFEVNPDYRFTEKTMLYVSGGAHSGCEDPRITKIGDRIYMCYVAFNGNSEPRLALTSIKVDDFLSHNWNWERSILISPPHVGDKSGCLFPEKINGNYVFLHRIFPSIWIDFVPDLNFEERWLEGKPCIKPRPGKWESHKLGAGAPPIKTEAGWLLITQGVSKEEGEYKVGAVLLDLEDPTKIIARSERPILEPYDGRQILYPCGATVLNDKLFVYYGEDDLTLGVAEANLNKFLEKLLS